MGMNRIVNTLATLLFAVSCQVSSSENIYKPTPSPVQTPIVATQVHKSIPTILSTPSPSPVQTPIPTPTPIPTAKPSPTPSPSPQQLAIPNYQTVLSEAVGQFVVDSDGVVRRVTSGVLYTFDDCEIRPGQGTVANYISVLKNHGIKNAIFFMYYRRCYAVRPDLVAMIKNAGYTIGNHGWDHREMVRLIREQGTDELEHEINGGAHDSIYLRPPGGEINPYVVERIRANGFVPMLWSASDNDTYNQGRNSCNTLLSYLISTVKHGSIVLMHMQIAQGPNALDAYLSGKTSC
ncbi:MAG: polysaccharide deacetylase family protein [Candidatus Aenigmarchaeota archaeon]|nr:polysaccharide deacetylase family protein [Candidatus Aenigmarchaeota archaeon]